MFEELLVDVLAFRGLEAGGHGAVTTAAAQATTEATAEATATSRWAVVVVATRSFGAGARHQRKGYALWKNETIS